MAQSILEGANSDLRPSGSAVRCLHADEELVLGELQSACIAVWRSKPTFSNFQLQRESLTKLARRAPGQAVLLCVVEADCKPPDDSVRKASSEMVSELGANLRRVACVIEGSGFLAAITRSVLSGMQLLVRSGTDVKFFRSVTDAVLWMRSNDDAASARDYANAVDALRRRRPAATSLTA